MKFRVNYIHHLKDNAVNRFYVTDNLFAFSNFIHFISSDDNYEVVSIYSFVEHEKG